MNINTKSRLALAAVLAIAGLSAATTLAVGGITGTGSSSSTGTQSVGGGTVTKQSITDFTLSVSDGDKGESLPFLSSVIRNSNGTVNANHNVTVTLTRPDSSSTYFVQKTDNDGRLRGHITGDNLTQVGSYNLSAHVWSGKTASDTFSIREKLFKDLDDQVVTGRRQHFRNRTNDTNAFSIEDASGDSIFSVDTILKQITVGDLRPKVAGDIERNTVSTLIDGSLLGEDNGYAASIAMGNDDLPRIVQWNSSSSAVEFLRCQDKDCASFTKAIISPDAYVYYQTGLAIGQDGFARIAYVDNSTSALMYARCNDADCTSPVISTIDQSGGNDDYPSLVVGSDGFSRVAFVDWNTGYINYARCTDDDCTTPVVTTVTSNSPSYGVRLAVAPDGFGRIAYDYYDSNLSFTQVHYMRCTDADCTSPVDTAVGSESGFGPSLVLDSAGLARIGFSDDSDYQPELALCSDADCASVIVRKFDPTAQAYGNNDGVALTLGSDGLPRVAYFDYNAADGYGALKYARCADATCSNITKTTLDDTPQDSPGYTSRAITVGGDGYARIAYGAAASNYDLKFARLISDDGTPVVTPGTTIGSVTNPFGDIISVGLNVQGAGGEGLLRVLAGNGTVQVGENMSDASADDYAVADIPYAPATLTGSAESLTLSDDDSRGVVLPFSFRLYNKTYRSLYISSNGYLSFSADDTTSTGGYTLGDGGSPTGLIAGHWKDLDPDLAGTIKYETQGVLPNRVFIVEYTGVPECCSDPDAGKVTFQVKLFEGTNNVEIHTTSADDSTNNSNAAQGLESPDGEVAHFLSGRDGDSPIDLTNDAVRFTYSSHIADLGEGSLAVQNQLQVGGASVLGSTDQSYGTNIALTVNAYNGDAIQTRTNNGRGIYAVANNGTAIYGETYAGRGVQGYSSIGHGVFGNSNSGLGVYGASSLNYSGYFASGLSSNPSPTLVVRQTSSGTADLFQVQNTGGAATARIDYQGNLTAGNITAASLTSSGALSGSNLTAGTYLVRQYTRALPTTVGDYVELVGWPAQNDAISFDITLATEGGGGIGTVVKKYLFQVTYDSSGNFVLTPLQTTSQAGFSDVDFELEYLRNASAPNDSRLRIKRTAGTSARNIKATIVSSSYSAMSSLTSMTGTGTSSGIGFRPYIVAADSSGSLGVGVPMNSSADAKLIVNTGAAGTVGAIVQGASSQSADLLQAKNSTGTVLAKIDASGNLTVQSLVVNGSITVAMVNKTSAYTLTSSDNIITADAASGAFTVTLPTAVGIKGREYTIKRVNSGANAVTVGTTSGQTIDGAATYSLSAQYKFVTVVSDGNNWLIIGAN